MLKGKSDKGGDAAHSAAIDCVRWLPDHRLATKSVDGRLFIWNTLTWERCVAIKVRPPPHHPISRRAGVHLEHAHVVVQRGDQGGTTASPPNQSTGGCSSRTRSRGSAAWRSSCGGHAVHVLS